MYRKFRFRRSFYRTKKGPSILSMGFHGTLKKVGQNLKIRKARIQSNYRKTVGTFNKIKTFFSR